MAVLEFFDFMSEFDGLPSITPIIMAGGSGTRLWPVSRETMPKQFINLMEDGRSTFQETLLRVSGPDFVRPIVITGNDFRFVVAEQMKAVDVEGEIVLEPERRDSAAAVATGALIGHERDPESICLVLAADHVVQNAEQFIANCRAAAREARGGRIMTSSRNTRPRSSKPPGPRSPVAIGTSTFSASTEPPSLSCRRYRSTMP